ncbi:hypothetical protein [Amycolatopsis vastitatis]|uniref:hypothetical protein n=1 Tax=Amycolatopsis vastitatis TaxID=1905142 RepID=UPI0013042DE5|nr:hypothetical protein [Amycolatopsis vastitatis]
MGTLQRNFAAVSATVFKTDWLTGLLGSFPLLPLLLATTLPLITGDPQRLSSQV